MSHIDRLLRRAAIRLMLVRLVPGLLGGATIGVAAVLLVRIVERLLAISFDWTLVWSVGLGGGLLAGIAWVVLTRPDRAGVAREVDERADLRESISTALCVHGDDDAWSRAAVEHASKVTSKVQVRTVFPFVAPRMWPAPIVGAVLFLVLGLVPRTDLLGLLNEAEAAEQKKVEVAQAQQDVESAQREVQEALKDIDVPGLEDGLEADETLTDAQTPEEIRRAEMKRLTTLQDRLEELRGGDKAMELGEMEGKLKRLRQPTAGPKELDALAKAMQAGDFEEAQKALEKLAEKVASGELNEGQKKELAEQMKALAEQLKALAQQQEALENELSRLGMDRKLASDPQALKKALENAENLTEAQKQQLQKMAQASQKACEACKNMGQNMSAAAAQLAQGQNGLSEMGELGQQLSEMEMMQQELEQLASAASAVSRQLDTLGECQGNGQGEMDWSLEKWQANSGGSGNRGKGGGKQPDAEEAAFDLERDKAKTRLLDDAPIVGTRMVQGEMVRGEARQEFSDAVQTASEAASEAIDSQVIPREYHDAIKHYFGGLEKAAAESSSSEGSTPDES
jgi:hypothetical protein